MDDGSWHARGGPSVIDTAAAAAAASCWIERTTCRKEMMLNQRSVKPVIFHTIHHSIALRFVRCCFRTSALIKASFSPSLSPSSSCCCWVLLSHFFLLRGG